QTVRRGVVLQPSSRSTIGHLNGLAAGTVKDTIGSVRSIGPAETVTKRGGSASAKCERDRNKPRTASEVSFMRASARYPTDECSRSQFQRSSNSEPPGVRVY